MDEGLKAILHRKEEICEQLVSLMQRTDERVLSEFEHLKKEYDAAGKLPEEYAEILDKKFSAAVKDIERHLERIADSIKKRESKLALLQNILLEGTRYLNEEHLYLEKELIAKLFSQFHETSHDIGDIEELSAKMAELERQLNEKIASETLQRDADIAEMNSIVEELKHLRDADPEEVKEKKSQLHKSFVAIRNKYSEDDAAMSEYDKPFREFEHELARKLGQYFQTLDLARWESYTYKLDVLKKLQILAMTDDDHLPKAARELQQIRTRWKQLGAVPHEKAAEVNPKYLELTRALQQKIDKFYRELHLKQKAAEEEKTKICEEAETLQDSTDWKNTTEKLKELQQKWKTLPNIGRSEESKLYERFRASCDKFFEARKADFAQRQEKFDNSSAEKEKLVTEAEKLSELPVGQAIVIARKLRADYQALPHAGKRERAIFERFNGALDKFFGARQQEFKENLTKRQELATAIGALSSEIGLINLEREFERLRSELKSVGMVPKNEMQSLEKLEVDSIRKAEKLIRELRQTYQSNLKDIFRKTVVALGDALECVDNAEALQAKLGAINADDLVGLPTLAANYKFLHSYSPDNDAAKLKQLLEKNRKEHAKLIDELEVASGVAKNEAADLAAELRAAMMGNFGGAVKETRFDRDSWLKQYMNAGMLPAAEITDSMKRFDGAWGKLG